MTHSKSDLRLTKVALLETRMGRELSSLVRKHGGIPVCIPSVSERPADASARISAFIDLLVEGRTNFVVFQTGVSINELVRVAGSLGRMPELVDGLRKATKVCRGPKPMAALKRLGLLTEVSVPEPHTTDDLIATLSDMPLDGAAVAVLHHGERNVRLIESLSPRCGSVEEIALYQWELPDDLGPLNDLVGELLRGAYDVVAFTSQIQVRHLFLVAGRLGLEYQLTQALRTDVVTAAVGPTCAAELTSRGVTPDVVPDHPKMGHMIVALTGYMKSRTDARVGAAV